MSLNSQHYASLSGDSYKDRQPSREPIAIDGVQYTVLDHMDCPSGYQGTIYQRVDAGEIAVAHRGTEVDHGLKAALLDGALADAGMVLQRTNMQTPDAIELVRRALEFAAREGDRTGHTPEVTVTGHSLGGTLAQITAHRFGLRGETFNAYGAASLGYGVPEGGDRIINHVMAADVVSAASHHYGQVRMYATPTEVGAVSGLGDYGNTRSQFDARRPVLAVFATLGSHGMHNFLDVDGNQQPDVSVLGEPQARQLASEYRPMFDKYRNDVYLLRGGISLGTSVAQGPDGFVDELRHRLQSHSSSGQGPSRGREPAPSGPHLPLFAPKLDGPSSLYRDVPEEPRTPRERQPAEASSTLSLTATLSTVERMLAAAQSGDWESFRKDTQALANSEDGRAIRTDATASVDQQEQLAVQQQAAQPQGLHESHVMRGLRMHH
jgi:lipase (class 3)